MNHEATSIALPKLCLWYDATRIQTWARLLVSVSPDDLSPNITEFAKRHVSDRAFDDSHAAPIDVVRSLPGLERVGERLVLRGVGLLEKTPKGYRLSDAGARLASIYEENSNDRAWVRYLATILLRREPRFRVLMKLLSKQEAVLLFTGEGWFGGVASKTELKIGDGQPIRPFAPSCSEDFQSLRPFIKENAWWALGEWQNHSLLENTTDVRFIGQLKEEFSLDKLAGNLRPALEVLAHLGVVQHYGAEAWIDHEAAVTELGLTCAQDFGWRFDGANEADPLSILATELERLRSDSGYVVASELREALHHRGIPNPDKRIGEWIRDGLVRLEGQNFGQARHGRGLFDDPEKQLIRLTLTGQHLTHS